MRCAGLFIIMEPDKAALLRARRSYHSAEQYRVGSNKNSKNRSNGDDDGVDDNGVRDDDDNNNNSDALHQTNFLEKISIPRGKRDGRDAFDYETAVREFIEETGMFFERAYVHRVPFVLQWTDAGVNYEYAIYVGVVRGVLKRVQREPNTFCVKLNNTCCKPNEYGVQLETRRFNNEIPRHLCILTLNDYFRYMNEKQLITYDSSNYLEFFVFVKNVKKIFDQTARQHDANASKTTTSPTLLASTAPIATLTQLPSETCADALFSKTAALSSALNATARATTIETNQIFCKQFLCITLKLNQTKARSVCWASYKNSKKRGNGNICNGVFVRNGNKLVKNCDCLNEHGFKSSNFVDDNALGDVNCDNIEDNGDDKNKNGDDKNKNGDDGNSDFVKNKTFKWRRAMRDNIVLATRRELMKIVNVV
ncbi:nudix [Lambdina fiscellaria nucleopolyhedrovirus]|uniref:Nudix n=1 Tax=Lambdina fiscellaria nucleopolyhedrovirus TaxID=1642929 RepID=A0A0E3Z6T9_9ABAC|nr:nudix [Lambdina fiscellaria nucleopolyhedrovirus]AKC91731.1 nudix [Lambdina fiscellaria nucleopolyhedrovirus]